MTINRLEILTRRRSACAQAILIASALSVLLFLSVTWLEGLALPWYRASRQRR